MMTSPCSSSGMSWSMTASTGAPALTMIMALRGRDNATDEFLHRPRGPDVFPLGFAGREFLGDLRRAIEDGDGETLRLHVEDEVFAHDGEADQANITLLRVHFAYLLFSGARQSILYLTRMANSVCEVLLTRAPLVVARGEHICRNGSNRGFLGSRACDGRGSENYWDRLRSASRNGRASTSSWSRSEAARSFN